MKASLGSAPSPSGKPAARKLERVRAEIAKLKADSLVVSDPHAVAWTFNIRGADVAHTPLPLACAIVPVEGGARVYIDEAKLTDAARSALAGLAEIRPEAAFAADLAALGAAHRTVRLDQATAAHAISQSVTAHGGRAPRGPDPILDGVVRAKELGTDRAEARQDTRGSNEESGRPQHLHIRSLQDTRARISHENRKKLL